MILFWLGNLFSLIGALFLLKSTLVKDKQEMLKLQIFDSTAHTISTIFLGGYSGAVTCMITVIRNVLQYYNRINKYIVYLFLVLILIVGLLFNNSGLIGVLPVVACMMYTLVMFKTTSAKHLKVGLIVNVLMWLIYDIYILAIPSIVTDLTIAVSTVISLIRTRFDSDIIIDDSIIQ